VNGLQWSGGFEELEMFGMDALILQADRALRSVSGVISASRSAPGLDALPEDDATTLDEAARRHSAGLMRVNHVGEICAQALYQSQALACTQPALRAEFERAAQEEGDHLAWTAGRLQELGAQPSVLNPFWYAGAFAFGFLAGKVGDRVSLGFVVETERQVEQHLASHLDSLPEADLRSRAIVAQMREDEVRHGEAALALGAMDLPAPVRGAMRLAAKVMTTTAYRI